MIDPGAGDLPEQSESTFLTGQRLGRFQVGQRLGSGGAAMVYRAYDLVEGRTVALKVLLPGADGISQSRFRQEARTASTLQHAHIVRTLQVGEAGEGVAGYIAMELVDGESLALLLERVGALSPQESCNLLEPIARALAYAHQKGVIHRDVKPSNILLQPVSPGTPNSVQLESLDYPVVPLLSDFGIARALDAPELTSAGRTIGTPAYMAPEQCSGSREADGRSDIYSLGAVLYRCLVGRAPFVGSTTQVLYAHVYEPLTVPDDILGGLATEIVRILRVSLAKNPEDRFAHAGVLAAQLARAAGRTPVLESTGAPQDQTATMTLASLPTVGGEPTRPVTASVLVPAPPVIRRTIPAPAGTGRRRPESGPPSAVPPTAPAGAPSRRTLNWTGLAVVSLSIMVVTILAVILGSGRNGLLPAVGLLQPAPATATIRPQPVGETGAAPAGDTATPTPVPDLPGGSAGGSAPAGGVPLPPVETDTPTPTSEIRPATDTPIPVPTATATPLPPSPEPPAPELPTPENPTPTATLPLPEATATPLPEIPPEEVVSGCSYTEDPMFLDFINRDPSLKQELGCPNNIPMDTEVAVQPFQNGFMLRRLDMQQIYVRLGGQYWVTRPATWQEGEPVRSEDPQFAPTGPGLFQPERHFGRLWEQDSLLRDVLGWATAPVSQFSAVAQSFSGGLLIGNRDDGQIYLFLRRDFQF